MRFGFTIRTPDMEYARILTIQHCVNKLAQEKKKIWGDMRNCVLKPKIPKAKMCKFVKRERNK